MVSSDSESGEWRSGGAPQLARRMQGLSQSLADTNTDPGTSGEAMNFAEAAIDELEASVEYGSLEQALSDAAARGLHSNSARPPAPTDPSLASEVHLREALPHAPERLGVPSLGGPSLPQASSLPGTPVTIEALLNACFQAGGKLDGSGAAVERKSTGLVFIEVTQRLAVCAERVRALSPAEEAFRTLPLKRRARGRELEEVFGGAAANYAVLEGRGLVVLEPSNECDLILIELKGEFVYLRESRVVGFEATIRHENGRLPAAEPGPIPMVQLTGEGVVVFEAQKRLGALAVRSERPLTVRGSSVLGWTGRLLGQAVPKEQSAFLGAGFVLFSGDGVVLVDDP